MNGGKERKMKNSVFLVFGRNASLRTNVAYTLSRWGITCITISEDGEIGKTTIENLEELSDKAKFAIVLFSGDDEGRLYEPQKAEEEKENLSLRARENVVAELGYFMAKYGRTNVCTLYEKGVNIPSDFSGVTYVSLEDKWELKLAQYLQKAGFNIIL